MGRPPRTQSAALAMARIAKGEVDVDPKLILKAIASDPSAPAASRVAAARVLLNHERLRGPVPPVKPAPADDEYNRDPIKRAAFKLLSGGAKC